MTICNKCSLSKYSDLSRLPRAMSTVPVELGVNKYPEKRTSTEIFSVIIFIPSDVRTESEKILEGAKVTHSNRHHTINGRLSTVNHLSNLNISHL